MKIKGLGKGLSALMGENLNESDNLREVFIDSIFPNPDQPRTTFSEAELEELQDSIVQNGVLQPILIKPIGENKYQIIAGERRWRASKMLGLANIPAIIKEVSDVKSLELALIENIQRENLTPLEEAESYKRLIEEHGYTQEKIAMMVSKARSHIANLLRLISLSDKVKRYLNDGLISLGHAKLLINLPDSDKVADVIVKRNLNVRDAENYIKYREEKPSAPKKDSHQLTRSEFVPKSTDIDELERSLSMALGMEVEIVGYGSGGTISLHYHHLEQLDQIVQKLTSSVK